jgi:hypothetical protein
MLLAQQIHLPRWIVPQGHLFPANEIFPNQKWTHFCVNTQKIIPVKWLGKLLKEVWLKHEIRTFLLILYLFKNFRGQVHHYKQVDQSHTKITII